VLFAPVPLLLECRRDLRVALSTFGFGNVVLVALPTVVAVTAFFVAGFVAGMIGVSAGLSRWLRLWRG